MFRDLSKHHGSIIFTSRADLLALASSEEEAAFALEFDLLPVRDEELLVALVVLLYFPGVIVQLVLTLVVDENPVWTLSIHEVVELLLGGRVVLHQGLGIKLLEIEDTLDCGQDPLDAFCGHI